jgi:hypothetical protein
MGIDSGRSRILARVRKMLALATSSNEHEAVAAREAADSLKREHGLTDAEISAPDEQEIHEMPMGAAGFEAGWKFTLVTVVARSCHCEAVGLRVGERRKVRIVGKRPDVDRADRIFRHLLVAIDRLAAVEIGAIDWDDPSEASPAGSSDPEAYLDSYRLGAVARVSELFRSRSREREDPAPGRSTALAIDRQDRGVAKAHVVARFADTMKTVSPFDAPGDDRAFIRGYGQAGAITLPGRAGAGGDHPDRPTNDGPAEVFVGRDDRPAVDVVVTQSGNVPIDPSILEDRFPPHGFWFRHGTGR